MNNGSELSTRKTILNMLKTNASLSVNEISRHLGITEMAVRRHMNTLERDGLIVATLMRQSLGRPAHVYSLTEQADDLFPKNYHRLTLDLLGELAASDGDDAVGRLFEKRKIKLLNSYEERMQGKELIDRVTELAAIQNAAGYMVEWESDGTGQYIFQEFNCPISQVANRYDHACDCELALFRSLLETAVDRTECLSKGGQKCVYVIQADALS